MLQMFSSRFRPMLMPDDGGGGGAVVDNDVSGAFEAGDDGDLDIVLVDQVSEKKAKPEPVEQLANSERDATSETMLANQAAQSKALIDGLGALGDKIGKVQPINVPLQQPQESEEEFAKRIEEELYKPGGAAKALREATNRQLGPLVGAFQSEILSAKKELLQHDPELGAYYKRFKDEVEQRVQATPRNQWDGEIYRRALKDVLIEKGPTLRQEEMAEQIKKGIEEGLKAAGIDTSKSKAVPAPAMQALGGRASTVEQPVSRREKLEVTKSDVQDMIARGLISSAEDLKPNSPYIEAVKVYIERKRSR